MKSVRWSGRVIFIYDWLDSFYAPRSFPQDRSFGTERLDFQSSNVLADDRDDVWVLVGPSACPKSRALDLG